MRKVILNVAMTLDGLIEGPKGEYDWCFDDGQDYGMTEFLNRIDAIFYGRKSYEMMMKAGGTNPFGNKKSYVFSNSLPASDDYEVVKGDIKASVLPIKNSNGKDIWLFGGAQLTTSMLTLNLVDELLLAVHPIVLGRGKPLFSDLPERCHLQLLDSKPYSSGLVQLHYQIQTEARK